MISVEWLKCQDCCYEDDELKELFPEPKTIREVLECQEGRWANVSWTDRMWVMRHYIISARLEIMIATYLQEVANAPDYVWSDPYSRSSEQWIHSHVFACYADTPKQLFYWLFYNNKTAGLPIILRYLP